MQSILNAPRFALHNIHLEPANAKEDSHLFGNEGPPR